MPNQEKVRAGLAREDLFTVVFEQVWTDTAPLRRRGAAGDGVPGAPRAVARLRRATSSTGSGRWRRRRARRGRTTRSSPTLVRRLGSTGPGDPETAGGARRARCSRRSERIARASCSTRDGIARCPTAAPAPVQFVDAFPLTAGPQGPPRARGARPRGAARPLRLPARSGDRAASAGADLAGHRPHASARPSGSSYRGTVAARDAPRRRRPPRHRATATRVRVWNELGEVRVTGAAQPRPAARRRLPAQGAVEPPHPLRHHRERARAPTPSPTSAGACFNDARVEIDKIS